MKRMELFDEFTYIDDAFILEAHETPVPRHPRFSLRRAAVLLAAVVTVLGMSVVVMANTTEDLSLQMSWMLNKFINDSYVNSYFGMEGNAWVELHGSTEELDDREIKMDRLYSYTMEEIEAHVDCDGETLQVVMEAMVLMDDGTVKYKSCIRQGEGTVSLKLDNVVAGEPGNIIHSRITIYVQGENEWALLCKNRAYLPPHFGFEVPYGTDVRFPDMRYNYDGRATPEETTPPTLPVDTEADAIVPEGSDVVVVIEGGD